MAIFHVLVALLGFLSTAHGLSEVIILEVEPEKTRCIWNTVSSEQSTSISYNMKQKDSTLSEDVEAILRLPGKRPSRQKMSNGSPSKFEAHEVELYKICFQNKSSSSKARIEVKEEVNTVPSGNSQVHKKGLQATERLIVNAVDMAGKILKEMEQSASWEEERQAEEQSLKSRITMHAAFTVVVLVSVTAWKLVLLNQFFRSRKLI